MSSNNDPTGNNAQRPDNPNVATPPLVPALPGPAADDADDELIVANGDDAGSVSSGESQNPLSGITPCNVFSPPGLRNPAMMDLECLTTMRFPMRASLIRTTVFICVCIYSFYIER
jgi:hypothetical protein